MCAWICAQMKRVCIVMHMLRDLFCLFFASYHIRISRFKFDVLELCIWLLWHWCLVGLFYTRFLFLWFFLVSMLFYAVLKSYDYHFRIFVVHYSACKVKITSIVLWKLYPIVLLLLMCLQIVINFVLCSNLENRLKNYNRSEFDFYVLFLLME